MSVGAFLISRLSSTRLPRKALLEILGKPMIEHLIDRVRRASCIDQLVLATSNDPSDDALEELARRCNIGCHRGPLDDIMRRVADAARSFRCDTIVEILADNPFVHSDLIEDVVRLQRNGGYDYAANVTREHFVTGKGLRWFPVGSLVQVYSLRAAERHVEFPGYVAKDIGSTNYIFEHPEAFTIGHLEASGRWAFANRPSLNLAVNHKCNFDMARTVFERLFPEDTNFGLDKVLSCLDENRYLYLLLA